MITGRGGLPTSPVDLLSDNSIWQDIVPVEPVGTDSIEETTVFSNNHLNSS